MNTTAIRWNAKRGSWHLVEIVNGAAPLEGKTLCGRQLTLTRITSRTRDAIPGDEKSCETCLRLERRALHA